jgi:hypothetical protein
MQKPTGASAGSATRTLVRAARSLSSKLCTVRSRASSAGRIRACASCHPSYQIFANCPISDESASRMFARTTSTARPFLFKLTGLGVHSMSRVPNCDCRGRYHIDFHCASISMDSRVFAPQSPLKINDQNSKTALVGCSGNHYRRVPPSFCMNTTAIAMANVIKPVTRGSQYEPRIGNTCQQRFETA